MKLFQVIALKHVSDLFTEYTQRDFLQAEEIHLHF